MKKFIRRILDRFFQKPWPESSDLRLSVDYGVGDINDQYAHMYVQFVEPGVSIPYAERFPELFEDDVLSQMADEDFPVFYQTTRLEDDPGTPIHVATIFKVNGLPMSRVFAIAESLILEARDLKITKLAIAGANNWADFRELLPLLRILGDPRSQLRVIVLGPKKPWYIRLAEEFYGTYVVA